MMKNSIGVLAAIATTQAIAHAAGTKEPETTDEMIESHLVEVPISNFAQDVMSDSPAISKYAAAGIKVPKDQWRRRKTRLKQTKKSRRANRR